MSEYDYIDDSGHQVTIIDGFDKVERWLFLYREGSWTAYRRRQERLKDVSNKPYEAASSG